MAKAVWITGASSGIGRALALELAGRGYDLALTARRMEKLESLRAEIAGIAPSCRVAVAEHDVKDVARTAELAPALDAELGGLDIVVANAGIGGSGAVGSGKFAAARSVIDTNLLGAMATVDAAVELFRKKRGPGHVVGISSVAGVRGLPGSAAYSASKAGLTAYLEATRGEDARHSIRVSTILPGYIDTPINATVKKRPFVIPVETGARKIADLIEKEKLQAAVPAWPWSLLTCFLRNLPVWVWFKATALKPRPSTTSKKK